MIAIAGGSGRLGRILARRLAGRGESVRVLTRAPEAAARDLAGSKVELVECDVRDGAQVERAVAGARIVISALSAFAMRGESPRAVDFEGNSKLILAAENNGVDRFILVSALGASAESKMELSRMKYRAERRLIASKLAWTILRPAPFIETFQAILCAPLLSSRKAVVFGLGQNPINFVSAHDVAGFVELATTDPALVGAIIAIGGHENPSLLQFIDAFRAVTGMTGSVKHIPRFVLKALSQLARPFNPTLARMAQAGVLMDTTDMSFDARKLTECYPQVALTTIAAVARRDYGNGVQASRVPA